MPFAIGQGHALGAGDDPRALGTQLIAMGKGVHVMRGIQRLQFSGRHMVCNHRHGSPFPESVQPRMRGPHHKNMIKLSSVNRISRARLISRENGGLAPFLGSRLRE